MDAERILIFSTSDNLTHLGAATTIFGDGTFYTCPDLFTQLYTLHAFVDGAIYPLVYALLPGKSHTIYTRFLNLLKETCQQHGIELQPTLLFIDYEAAVRNAAYTVFLFYVFIFYISTIKCRVHVCRNLLLIFKMIHISYVKCKLS